MTRRQPSKGSSSSVPLMMAVVMFIMTVCWMLYNLMLLN